MNNFVHKLESALWVSLFDIVGVSDVYEQESYGADKKKVYDVLLSGWRYPIQTSIKDGNMEPYRELLSKWKSIKCQEK